MSWQVAREGTPRQPQDMQAKPAYGVLGFLLTFSISGCSGLFLPPSLLSFPSSFLPFSLPCFPPSLFLLLLLKGKSSGVFLTHFLSLFASAALNVRWILRIVNGLFLWNLYWHIRAKYFLCDKDTSWVPANTRYETEHPAFTLSQQILPDACLWGMGYYLHSFDKEADAEK